MTADDLWEKYYGDMNYRNFQKALKEYGEHVSNIPRFRDVKMAERDK